jgi:hypothetical protein
MSIVNGYADGMTVPSLICHYLARVDRVRRRTPIQCAYSHGPLYSAAAYAKIFHLVASGAGDMCNVVSCEADIPQHVIVKQLKLGIHAPGAKDLAYSGDQLPKLDGRSFDYASDRNGDACIHLILLRLTEFDLLHGGYMADRWGVLRPPSG